MMREFPLVRAAKVVLARFAEGRAAGALPPSQYSALLDLEEALRPYAGALGLPDLAGDRPPGFMEAPRSSSMPARDRRPAADLASGDIRFGFAMGRPGA